MNSTPQTASARAPAPLETVEIFDNDESLGTTQTDEAGTWTWQVRDLPPGLHVFFAQTESFVSRPWRINVGETPTGIEVPYVEGIAPPVDDAQRFNYHEHRGDLSVIVPPGYLRPDDTVKLHWIGRDGFRVSSETRTVTDPVEPMPFTISRYEVIDAIGYQTTDVHYTIKRPPSSDLIVSRHLNLTVTGQDFVINAPTIDATHETLSVRRQGQFSAATRVRVRAVGNTSWESSFKAFGTENALNFTISTEWIAANRGIPVVFNYSVQMDASSPDLLFSRILRVDELVTPVDIRVPFVEEAPAPENDVQQLDYYQHLDDIHVIVPVDYLRSGDTVKLYWTGRNSQWSPEIVTVADPVEPLSFAISKYEVIDVIGLPNTGVRYSVRRPPSPGIVYSRHLRLRVTGHEPAIEAPTLSDARDSIRVWRLLTFNDTTKVTVRAIGISTWEGKELIVGSAEYVDTPIDPAWLAENRGKSVLFNYHVRFNPADPHVFFSLLLRIDSL